MGPFAALLLAAVPLTAPLPPGTRAIAGVQVEIVRAERVRDATDADAVHRNVRRAPQGLIVEFD